MSSFLAWMDYSEHDRRRALDVIDLFQEKDTRDELGVGVVRDAFSDLLFPGTSTIQTRAKYFLFVPWIYQDLERRHTPSSAVAAKARREEVGLIEELMKSSDKEGIFGVEAGAKLKRLPSNVYWQGLGRWGIRLYPGSQDRYHHYLDLFYQLGEADSRIARNEGEPVDGTTRYNWHSRLPARPENFPKGASFGLTREEAEYLQERILAKAPGTFLAELVSQKGREGRTDFPWEHPLAARVSLRIKGQLAHARYFSIVMHGAALLYNLMLAEASGNEDKIDEYRERVGAWWAGVAGEAGALTQWDRREFWQVATSEGAPIPVPTRSFVDAWVGRVLQLVSQGSDAGLVASDDAARRVVQDREVALKRGQARLVNSHARELWSGAAGIGQMVYRWPEVQTIVRDIQVGLLGEEQNA